MYFYIMYVYKKKCNTSCQKSLYLGYTNQTFLSEALPFFFGAFVQKSLMGELFEIFVKQITRIRRSPARPGQAGG